MGLATRSLRFSALPLLFPFSFRLSSCDSISVEPYLHAKSSGLPIALHQHPSPTRHYALHPVGRELKSGNIHWHNQACFSVMPPLLTGQA